MNFKLNISILDIIETYLQDRKTIKNKTITQAINFLNELDNYSTASTNNEFPISYDYWIKEFRTYKQLLNVCIELGYIKLNSKSHKGKMCRYSFTEKYSKDNFYYKKDSKQEESIINYFKTKNTTRSSIIKSEFNIIPKLILNGNKLTNVPNFNVESARQCTFAALMTKDDRKNLLLNDEYLTEVDITASSFTLINSMLDDTVSTEDKETLRDIVQGDVYKVISEYSANKVTREEVKKDFMTFLFSSNKGFRSPACLMISKYFRENVPTYFEWMKKQKRRKDTTNKKGLAYDYFSLENHINNEVTKRLNAKNIDLCTIYDAVLVSKEHIKEAKETFTNVIKEQFDDNVLNDSVLLKIKTLNTKPEEEIEEETGEIVVEVLAVVKEETTIMKTKDNLKRKDGSNYNGVMPKIRERSFGFQFKENSIKKQSKLTDAEIFESIK